MRRSRIWGDQNGNTAIIFGFALIPILGLSGGGVDLTHRAQVRTAMQSAADTAALAAARLVQEGHAASGEGLAALKAQAQRTGETIFAATAANLGSMKPEVSVSIGESTVTVSAAAKVPTSFLSVLGIPSLKAEALAEVGIPNAINVEIALVLDYSRSMLDDNKYLRMSTAARSFVQRIGLERGEHTRIGIVPFSEYVYAELPGAHIRGSDPALANTLMTACLMNRDYPYSASNDEPTSIDGTLWPAADPTVSPCADYAAKDLRVRNLTGDYGPLSSSLATMDPVGMTNIALGAEMGWRMLAGGAADAEVRKIMILLTDGVQTVPAMGPGGEVSTLAADETTADLCDNADAAGIQIFTVAYDVSDPRIHELLSNCASQHGGYHEADDAGDISEVFESIFDQITASVWLSR